MSASPMHDLALLFPGQGVGDESARELVASERPDLLELAYELVGEDPFARIADGTRFAQPAIYCASLAGLERLGRPEAGMLAGHSLGEISALAAAGVVDDADGLRIVVERGRLMDAAAASGEAGGMLAVGGDRDQAQELASSHGLTLANENSPRQFVLSGPEKLLDAATAAAKEAGLRAKRLAVSGAFHSPAMETVVASFEDFLDGVEFSEPRVPVLSCVTAAPFGADVRATLASAITKPVRWVEVLRRLREEGGARFVDVGPGKVLAGLVKRTLDGVTIETNQIPEAQGV
ncbi:MAG TPA: ACP S-malonyltransferase [Solirubrobacterales bacterium]|nr:ACP S-malonyltransferase [Solirubrobacterales bacterium]